MRAQLRLTRLIAPPTTRNWCDSPSSATGCCASALDEEIAQPDLRLSITFDKVVTVLSELGYLADETVTDAGMVLRSIYSERPVGQRECLREGVWRDLAPPELAAVVASLVYTSRRESAAAAGPTARSAALRGAPADTNRDLARSRRGRNAPRHLPDA